MIGAILGDIIGSPFEFDTIKTKDFVLLSEDSHFTDDSVMTMAITLAVMYSDKNADEKTFKKNLVRYMQGFGRIYPNCGYGRRFIEWMFTDNPQPYNSCGNGAAMRVSPVGWYYDSLERTLEVAQWTAEVSHNHPEGIKAAQATAAAIYLARKHKTKDEIKQYIEDEFGYNLGRTCDEIRPNYYHIETSQDSVPEAFICFFEGNNYIDVVRNAVSLGGDADTQACIAGSIAEAYYGISPYYVYECERRIPGFWSDIIDEFYRKVED